MRAVVVKQHGGPDVLTVTDLAAPQAAPGSLVVDVEAAGVNFMDIYQRQGNPPYAVGLPYVPGVEGAGTVVAAGPGVTAFAAGDKVAWTGVAGSYAEQVAIPADRAVPIPDGVRPRVAAAVMLQGLTAHYLANSTYPIAAGDPVVVHAAAGGVGLLLTQLVKMRGGTAIATTSTADKAELARRAGADHVIDYEDFATAVREITDGAGAAVVYDGVGRATFDESLTALRPRGYLVLYGAASGPVPPLELQRLAGGGSLFVTRPTLVHHIASRAELLRRANDLFTWIRQGRLEVRIGGTYPLDDAAQAHDDLAARRTTGKLLLLPR
ncbi:MULTISPECIES: quinone oxidoreductase [unclassified Frankia]|uniref:quinone oxidoreductase family protein n=1 Tax=unclassified Frankia TaxID=2632575 RepID=UPI001EF50C2B|nr:MULTISPECIES: quinone oxidoreductase [unclassified Frankia]